MSTGGVKMVGALSLFVLLSAFSTAPDSPVADAAMRGDAAAVRTLLKEGADVNAAHGDGMTALHWAAEHGDDELAGMLIYAGANVAAVTRIGQYTPLHLASKSGSTAVIRMLVEGGADVKAATTTSGATPLHFAAASGVADAVAVLIDHGADLNAREAKWGQTPLIFAAAANRPDAIRVLLERGADPDLITDVVEFARASALSRAASERRDEVLAAFGGAARPVAEGDDRGRGEDRDETTQVTPSQVRAAAMAMREVYRSGEVEIRPPDQRRGPPLVTNQGGMTALLHAARQGYREATVALLDGGADIDRVSASDATSPLLIATINGQFDLAMLLIERGANPNLASELNGATPLWSAINSYWQPRTRFPQPKEHQLQQATYLDVMKALLNAGADPDARMTRHPWYMLYGGCGNGNCGLEVTDGATAFWRAAYGADVEAMRLLASYGADPLIPTKKPAWRVGTTVAGVFTAGPDTWDDQTGLPEIPVGGPGSYAIHASSGIGYGQGLTGNAHVHMPDGWMPSVRFLVEELGFDVNMRDHYGYTPLHHAAARGDNELILYLVSKGADVTLLARTGQSVADMANGPVERLPAMPETIRLLEALGSINHGWCVTC